MTIHQILNAEIILSVLKLMYLSEYITDSIKLSLKIKVRVISIGIKRNLDDRIRSFCSEVNQTFLLFLGHPIVGDF